MQNGATLSPSTWCLCLCVLGLETECKRHSSVKEAKIVVYLVYFNFCLYVVIPLMANNANHYSDQCSVGFKQYVAHVAVTATYLHVVEKEFIDVTLLLLSHYLLYAVLNLYNHTASNVLSVILMNKYFPIVNVL